MRPTSNRLELKHTNTLQAIKFKDFFLHGAALSCYLHMGVVYAAQQVGERLSNEAYSVA